MMRRDVVPATTRRSVIVLLGLLSLMGFGGVAMGATTKTYDFTVLLDDDEIGHQRFDVTSEGERTQIRVSAEFKVKFLLITVYTYRHSNVETWQGSCLSEIQAETNDNGDAFFVKGSYRDGRLQWQTQAGERAAEGCVKTFAYWNQDWLTGDRLLNSQTGELQRADIDILGKETIAVRGSPTPTTHRRIVTDQFTIDLWHGLDGEWVALQSTTNKGKTLHYRLQ
ncbi:MAG: DUF6134 family protein [Nitrospira sp.]|nr:DUF6134 family protein [Nitrospira sp.]